MSNSPFDNLPQLTKEEALNILKTPINELNLSSDYYKAVFHLSKYPCLETEESLLTLLKSEDKSQAIVIARRKSIEVLARIGCKRAMPLIAKTLDSDDPYVVENATWALQELNCTDVKLHKCIANLLNQPKHNRRVLIKLLF